MPWHLFVLVVLLGACAGGDPECSEACPDGTRRATFDEAAAARGQQFYVQQSCETLCEPVQPCVPPNIPVVTADDYQCAPLEGFADIPAAADIDFSFALEWEPSVSTPVEGTLVESPETLAIVAIDGNADGLGDVATAGPTGMTLWLGDGAGGLTAADGLARFHNDVGQLFAVDVDGDGQDDLISHSEGHFAVGRVSGGEVQDRGRFALGADTPAVAGDVDGDGLADLVYDAGSGVVTVAFGDGTGDFPEQVAVPIDSLVAAGGGCTAPALALGDLDGEGNADVVVACGTSIGGALWSGARTLREAPVSGLPFDAADLRLAIGDLTGDGIPDVATHRDASLTVLPGQGGGALGGAFDVTDSCPSGGASTEPVLADLDEDGALDAVALGAGCGTFNLALGPVAAGAADERVYRGGGGDLAATDLDGDGWSELLVTDPGGFWVVTP